MSIAGIIHELRKAKGRNTKVEILKKHNNNAVWKKILYLMYDESINYGVRSVQDMTFIKDDSNVDYSGLQDDLNPLIFSEITGNEAKKYALKLSRKYGEVFRLILGRSLRAGIQTTTINNVYKDLIPVFKVMKAEKTRIVKWPILASIKYDGIRLVVKKCGDHVLMRTTSGKELNLLSLKQQFIYMPDGVYDGELVSGTGRVKERTKITGYVNKILFGSMTEIPKQYSFMVFDFIELSDWEARKTRPYSIRHKELKNINERHIATNQDISNIKIAEQYLLYNLSAVNELYEELANDGWEGIIIRYQNDSYVWGRSTKMLKRKAEEECVLKCVDVQEGKGKYAGMVGALICVGKIGSRNIKVKVGTGLSDYDRQLPTEYYLGKNIEIVYNTIVKRENSDTYSLFLPRFKRMVGNKDI